MDAPLEQSMQQVQRVQNHACLVIWMFNIKISSGPPPHFLLLLLHTGHVDDLGAVLLEYSAQRGPSRLLVTPPLFT
jgi:hypothetical protein